MKWLDILKILAEAEAALPLNWNDEMVEKERGWALNLDSWISVEHEQKKGLDAVIRVYSRSRQWPELSPDENLFLLWRFDAAQTAVSVLNLAELQLGILTPTRDEEDLIEWALIQLWDDEGYGAIHEKMEFFAKGFATRSMR